MPQADPRAPERMAPAPGAQDADARTVPGGEGDRGSYLPVMTLRRQVLDYIDNKTEEIAEQQDARRYYHGAHWTAEQLRILRARHQPPTTWNRTARKINGIVGLVERMRSDPKALARTPKSEQGAEIATQSIRYVLDANAWKNLEPWCLLQCCIDGVAGVQRVLTQGDRGDPDIALPWVIGDEYFYDPTSYRMDFSDVRYEGLSKWMHVDDAIELFPDKEDDLRGLIAGDSDLTTNSDRDYKWVMPALQKVRMVEHWYKHKGRWCWAFYVANTILAEGDSPWFDERGKSARSFNTFRAAVDQDGDSYGFVRNLRPIQDALNQGKTKTLHIANSRRLIMEKGAVDDIEVTRREWARPDGVVERNPGKDIKPDDTRADLAAFASFTEDAKNEIEQYANTGIGVAGGVAPTANLSGRAIELLRQPGMAELGPFVLAVRGWKLGLYRDIWSAVQRYWSEERWIRVSNNEGVAQFIQLNGLGLDQHGLPAIVNAVGALDVDIILEEGADVGALMQDTYDAVKGDPTIPANVKIEMSALPRSEKDRILKMMMPQQQPPNPLAIEAQRLQLEALAGKNAKTAAETHKTLAGAELATATAMEKHAKIGDLAHDNHIDAATFARDTLLEAAKVHQELNAPPQQRPQQQPMPAPQPQAA